MEVAYFTKTLQDLPLEQAAATTADLGFDCADLLIRDGHAVSPAAPENIGRASRLYGENGVRVAMATVDATRPDAAAAHLLGRCADAGIGQVRLGFWRYDPSRRWQAQVDEARRDLDGFEALAGRLGIVLTLQLHGGTLHGSGALAARLLAGRDPARIGAYPDPANQIVGEGGENWRATLDLLDPWFCCIGVKNGGWSPAACRASGQRAWQSSWYPLDEGMVPWDEIVPHLVDTGFQGLVSLHSQYRVPRHQALDKVRADLAYFRRLVATSKGVRS